LKSREAFKAKRGEQTNVAEGKSPMDDTISTLPRNLVDRMSTNKKAGLSVK
jgi:hypothetical protein